MGDSRIIAFNQSYDAFACYSDNMLQVFNVEPFAELEHMRIHHGPISISKIEMLNRSNFLILVPDTPITEMIHRVFVYDHEKKRIVMTLKFYQKVLAVRLRLDYMAVVFTSQIEMYSFPDCTYLIRFQTFPNPKGICELGHSQPLILAYPGLNIGTVSIQKFPSWSSPGFTMPAHLTHIVCIAISRNGTMLATASEKGTLIRVFDILRPFSKLFEFRRGFDQVSMRSINFSPDDKYLCCSSNKETIHIFAIFDPSLNRVNLFNPLYYLSPRREILDMKSFKLPAHASGLCVFGPKDGDDYVVYTLYEDGMLHKCTFSETGSITNEYLDNIVNICPHYPGEL